MLRRAGPARLRRPPASTPTGRCPARSPTATRLRWTCMRRPQRRPRPSPLPCRPVLRRRPRPPRRRPRPPRRRLQTAPLPALPTRMPVPRCLRRLPRSGCRRRCSRRRRRTPSGRRRPRPPRPPRRPRSACRRPCSRRRPRARRWQRRGPRPGLKRGLCSPGPPAAQTLGEMDLPGAEISECRVWPGCLLPPHGTSSAASGAQ